MRREDLKALPAVVDVGTAADALGLSRTAAYELIRAGHWPTPSFRVGRLIRIPSAPLLALLCVRPDDDTGIARPAAGAAVPATRAAG